MNLDKIKEQCIKFIDDGVDKIMNGNIHRLGLLLSDDLSETKKARLEVFFEALSTDEYADSKHKILDDYLKSKIEGESFRSGLADEFMESIVINLLLSDFFIDAAEEYINQE